MRHSSHGLRIALLAGASVVALAAAAPSAGAADMNKPMPMKAPPALPVAKDTWTWWIEGGAFNTGGGSIGIPPFKPNWGGEGAVGFDWQTLPQMHVVGQFRYGTASKSTGAHSAFSTGGGTTVHLNGNQNLREDHWLIDFDIGRDFGLGNSNAMWTLGVRVADLRSKLNLNAASAATHTGVVGPVAAGNITAQERSTFVGAGPRLGVQGDIPLGGQWSIDWLGGAAVLFGERSVQSNATAVTAILAGKGAGSTVVTIAAANASDSPAIFNVDAQAGLSYWFSSNTKFTVGYRFDEYFRALKTVTSVTNGAGTTISSSNLDRSFSGPMARLTVKF